MVTGGPKLERQPPYCSGEGGWGWPGGQLISPSPPRAGFWPGVIRAVSATSGKKSKLGRFKTFFFVYFVKIVRTLWSFSVLKNHLHFPTKHDWNYLLSPLGTCVWNCSVGWFCDRLQTGWIAGHRESVGGLGEQGAILSALCPLSYTAKYRWCIPNENDWMFKTWIFSPFFITNYGRTKTEEKPPKVAGKKDEKSS